MHASEIKKILVRSPNWIGDQIMAFPFFYYLRKAYPKAKITVSCVPWVEDVQFRNLVDQVVVLPRPLASGLRSKLETLEEGARLLRKGGPWDLGIALPNSFSSAWILYRAKARLRRGYSADGRGWILNQGLPWNSENISYRPESYLQLLPEAFRPKRPVTEFWGIPPENELDEPIPGELESFDAAAAWSHVTPLEPPKDPYWIMAPGTTADSRRWPLERYAELARKIYQDKGLKGIIIGGPAEAPIAERLVSDPGSKLSDWTAQGPVSSYWKVFKKAQFLVGNDSGLAHLAALCGTSVQIVWGAGNPKRTAPLGPGKVQTWFNPVECWPCERNDCVLEVGKRFECLRGIGADAVWKEIRTGFRLI